MLKARLSFAVALGLFVASIGGSAMASGGSTASGGSSEGRIPGQYIVVLNDRADAGAVGREHARSYGASVLHVYRYALRGYAARMSDQAASRIARDPRVLFVQPDSVVTATAQSLPTGINRVDGEQSATANINGTDERVNVDVAVIDTGIDTTHPDLNVVGGRNCSTGTGYKDGNGHGSHVAGTIAAKDNGVGVVGIAPGARLWAVRVLNNQGSGTMSSVVCGIDWVTSKAGTIEVANMSLGGSGSDDGNCGNSNNDAEHRAICRSVQAGVTYAVAAGNSSANSANHVPASYDEVITVSALADFNGQPGGGAAATCRSDVDDTFADFSNYGADVDIIAPGVCIRSTWKGGTYNTISGTSMASPHVAGGAALYKATHPSATPTEVKGALQSAGNLDWTWPSQDPDGIQETLLNVATL